VNPWVERSIRLAESEGYLDKLSEIYPAERLPRRPLEESEIELIKRLYREQKGEELVRLLLKLTRKKHPFPIEHPYASLIRQKPTLISKNPKVVKKLGDILLSMEVEDIIKGCERPPDINRVMGSAFQNWLRRKFSKDYPFLAGYQLKIFQGPAFFDGKNAAIREFVKSELGIELERGRDFLFKIGDTYVLGEARFLSTSGGSQTRDLQETISFVRKTKRSNLIAIAVIDGIVWYNNTYKRMLSELEKDEPALTALILEDFLKSLE